MSGFSSFDAPDAQQQVDAHQRVTFGRRRDTFDGDQRFQNVNQPIFFDCIEMMMMCKFGIEQSSGPIERHAFDDAALIQLAQQAID